MTKRLRKRLRRLYEASPSRFDTAAQIANAETWIESDRYVVEAKAPEHSGITNFSHALSDIEDERLRRMLQALLVDRFQLRVRRETRTGVLPVDADQQATRIAAGDDQGATAAIGAEQQRRLRRWSLGDRIHDDAAAGESATRPSPD